MNDQQPWWQVPFSYVRVPKALFADAYEKLSPTAKLLYALLLDRTNLSYVSGDKWQNEYGEYFVFYTLEEIIKRLHCGHDKASKLLRELFEAGLISRSLKGRGRPYRIVVKPFLMSAKITHPQHRKNRIDGSDESAPNNTELLDFECIKLDSFMQNERAMCEVEIKDNICYDVLLKEMPWELLNGIVNIILEVVHSKKPYIRIWNEDVSTEKVRSRFMTLDDMDIRYVRDKMKRERADIRNVRTYLIASLYEAQDVKDCFYEFMLNNDNKKEK